MLRNVRTCRYSQLFAVLGLLLVLNLNLMGAYGRQPGKGFIAVGPAAVEMSVSGYGVLVLSFNESQQGNNLDFYRGENLTQRTRILENALAFGLAARAYLVGVYLVFCYVHGGLLKYLQVRHDTGPAPQGPDFFISDVSAEEGFFSSDLLVTPDGDVLVLGYSTQVFQPRLFILRGAGSSPQGTSSRRRWPFWAPGTVRFLVSCSWMTTGA